MDRLRRQAANLERELQHAGSITVARQIKAELEQVRREIGKIKRNEQNRSDPAGRLDDIRYLKDKYHKVGPDGKNAIRRGLNKIANESERVRRDRAEMIKAKRDGDNAKFAEMQMYMVDKHG